MATQTFIGTLVIEYCCKTGCGVAFGMPADLQQRRLNDRGTFHCPNGHPQHYTGKSDIEKAKERTEQAERNAKFANGQASFWRERAQESARSAAAHKGHATRIRNLIAKGVCPVPGCRRNFANVKDHIATQHPDWHQHEGDES